MKERVLYNWNARRILYTLIGSAVTTSSILQHEWAGALFGLYFFSMGFFSFGCAGSGSCSRTR